MRGFICLFTNKKNKEGVGRISSNLGYKIQKIYMAGKLFAHNVWCERAQIEYTSQKMAQTISMKITNTCKIERHNFCFNYLLIKTNRTALQNYKVEERTFMDTLYSVPPLKIKGCLWLTHGLHVSILYVKRTSKQVQVYNDCLLKETQCSKNVVHIRLSYKATYNKICKIICTKIDNKSFNPDF